MRASDSVARLDRRPGGQAYPGEVDLRASEVVGVGPPQRAALVVQDERGRPVGVGQAATHRVDVVAHRGRQRVGGDLHLAHPGEVEPLERRAGTDEVLDELVGWTRQDQLRGGELGDVRLLLQDRDAVAHLDGLVDVVGDEDDRLADVGLDAQELVLEPVAGDGVDRAERLVHQHHGWVRAHRAGDAHPLALATGQLLGVAVPVPGVIQPDGLEQLVDACADLVVGPLEEPRHRGDVVRDRHVGEQADLLDDIADAAAQLVGVDVGDVLAVEDDPARRGLDEAVDQLHRGGLAAAGRPDQDDDLALRDVHRHAVDRGRGLPGEPLGDLLEPDHRMGCVSHGCLARS
ncbi:hypothetical protein BH20ACT8_BH20ACT8_12860 [soil metagenome]